MRKLFTILLTSCSLSVAIGQALPARPDTSSHYVFYLHGRIIENGDVRPVDKTWGLYDYPAVVRALGANGAVILSQQRQKDTDVREYAAKVHGQIKALVEAGVPQSHITVVGFSKGGNIAIAVSSTSGGQFPDIRYVFLAACPDWVLEQKTLSLSGHVRTIFESSDDATHRCSGLTKHAKTLKASSEVTINTGLGHGVFYMPREIWLKPALQWIHAK